MSQLEINCSAIKMYDEKIKSYRYFQTISLHVFPRDYIVINDRLLEHPKNAIENMLVSVVHHYKRISLLFTSRT